jgi:hypothetical protein
MRFPGLYELAAAIPDKGRAGRPRQFPAFMHIAFLGFKSVWKSARQTEAELAHPLVWDLIRRTVVEMFPDDPSMWLGEKPMRRHHYEHARVYYLRNPEVLAALKTLHSEQAIWLAIELGLLNPDGAGSFTHPDLSRLLYADGKVITPLYRAKKGDVRVDRVTGKITPLRYDPDAGLHIQGDGEGAFGTKFLITSVRSAFDRIIVGFDHVPQKGSGGEAGIALDCFRCLAPLAPGIQGVTYDMALRGVHIDAIMRELGWLTITKVAAKSNPTTRKGRRFGTYVPKSAHIENRTIKGIDGKDVTLALYALAGALGIGELSDDGRIVFVPLERIRTHRNQNKGGPFRWYNDYALPPEYGSKTLTVRLHGNPADVRQRLNRAENLRAIPPSDPDFAHLYARRNDAESINRALEDTLYINRAHSVGQSAQQADLLGFALVVNALSYARHRAREGMKPAA